MNWRLALAICFYRDWIRSHCSCRERAHRGEPEGGPRCSEKAGRTGLQIVRYFQEKVLRAHFLHLLVSRKALKSFVVTSAPHELQGTRSQPSVKTCAWLYLPLQQNHVYTNLPLCLFGAGFPSHPEMLLPGLYVLILPQMKRISQLWGCAYFLRWRSSEENSGFRI